MDTSQLTPAEELLANMYKVYSSRKITARQHAYGLRLGLPITGDTTDDEFRSLMAQKNYESTANDRQNLNLLSMLTIDQISCILKRKITQIDDILYKDYLRVMKVVNRSDNVAISCINHPEEITEKWEVGWQESPISPGGKLRYLCSYDYFMADVDFGYDGRDIQNVPCIERLTTIILEMHITARIYKTTAGFHVFITSQLVPHRSPLAKSLMEKLGGDIWYMVFSQRHGYKIRLSPKLGRENEVVAEYCATVGTATELPEIVEYMNLHDRLIEKYSMKQE